MLNIPPNFTGKFLGFVLAFVVGTTFARYCQAFVAFQLGDRQPRSEGRLSLRPGRHLDALGLILALLVALSVQAVAWGKPLNLNPYGNRLKRFGGSLVAITGPLAYFGLAAAARLLFGFAFDLRQPSSNVFAQIALYFIAGNVLFAAFSLLPLPPLDGWYFLKGFWPPRWDVKATWVETYGAVIVLVLALILPFFGLSLLYPYYFGPLSEALLSLLNL